MTVYVDAVFTAEPRGKQAKSHGVRWCHMIATDLDELHEMARKIGLKRRYFQPHPIYSHYDLVPTKRALAIAEGAQEITTEEKLRMRKCEPGVFCGSVKILVSVRCGGLSQRTVA
jgi:hypothetical protein